MRNCIYSSGQAVQVETGPCAPTDSVGGELVDMVDESTDVLVTTDAPVSYGMLAALLLAVVVGVSLLGGNSDV